MSQPAPHPQFGEADLSNCERELIHLAGSVQPHGAMLVLRESTLVAVQASINTLQILGVPHADLIGRSVAVLEGDLAEQVSRLIVSNLLTQPTLLRCTLKLAGEARMFDCTVHRLVNAGIVVELQPAIAELNSDPARLPQLLAEAVGSFATASSLPELGDAVVSSVRTLTGYDRVMMYRFDTDGHGEVIAEAKEESLEPFLGQHYPATDIPYRARELYLRNRVRVLSDARHEPVPIVPRHTPESNEELDMSLCSLRSMSPLHLQYLQNMGVTATLVTSLVREGRLWGLIACHHYSPKLVASETRSACELISEVVSTRIAALDNLAQANAESFVRQLEHLVIAAASETGDWRDALFRNRAEKILAPMNASGVALLYEGQVLTAGETPPREALREVAGWLSRSGQVLFQSASVPSVEPPLLLPVDIACGMLAVELSRSDHEYLMWFRKEQIRTVTWAGNPNKPMAIGNNPLDLSPRRSFAAWSELVRETSRQWLPTELAIAGAIRRSLVDVILQMRALRALIADRQAVTTLSVIEQASEPMILADGNGQLLLVNNAFHRLLQRPLLHLQGLDAVAALCADRAGADEMVRRISVERKAWRGELQLLNSETAPIPVAVRADPVPGLRGESVGYILMFTDLRQQHELRESRARLERAISERPESTSLDGVASMLTQDFDRLLSAVMANARAAVIQTTDAFADSSTGALMDELEAATRRAAELTAQILGSVSRQQPPGPA